MHELEKQMKTIQTQLKHWAEKAKQEYPSHLEASVRHAVDRMDPVGLARASEEVVATVTGNRKTARRARKAVEAALRKAQRKAGSKHNGARRALAVLGTAAVIGLVAVIVLRRAAGPHARDLGTARPGDSGPAKGMDPDLAE
ncbi:hypothetical protein ACIPVK_18715 [Paeniglutamicibacter sp. MACA_103]|uniref:hypothetical protein n=1 Tax=Paeniglutamicibacter sp. MACA_103 TaxID=3377337 RepID=UPI003894DE4C